MSNLVFFPVRWSLPLTLAADGGRVSGLENISAQASLVVAAGCCPEVSCRSALPSRDEKVATRGRGGGVRAFVLPASPPQRSQETGGPPTQLGSTAQTQRFRQPVFISVNVSEQC